MNKDKTGNGMQLRNEARSISGTTERNGIKLNNPNGGMASDASLPNKKNDSSFQAAPKETSVRSEKEVKEQKPAKKSDTFIMEAVNVFLSKHCIKAIPLNRDNDYLIYHLDTSLDKRLGFQFYQWRQITIETLDWLVIQEFWKGIFCKQNTKLVKKIRELIIMLCIDANPQDFCANPCLIGLADGYIDFSQNECCVFSNWELQKERMEHNQGFIPLFFLHS